MSIGLPFRLNLLPTLGVYTFLPLAMNGLIFAMGWQDAGPRNPMLPPGWVVGTIWMILFIGMGVARWILTRGLEPEEAKWVDGLALLCLVYPLYTVGLQNQVMTLAGAILTALAAFAIMVRVWRGSKTASVLVACVATWVLYAETALASALRR